ncbi:MAG TPA: hypothetical protein VGD05_06250 [Pyrinomonadaceae bacterium]|jgi:hypothetical protein
MSEQMNQYHEAEALTDKLKTSVGAQSIIKLGINFFCPYCEVSHHKKLKVEESSQAFYSQKSKLDAITLEAGLNFIICHSCTCQKPFVALLQTEFDTKDNQTKLDCRLTCHKIEGF